MMGKEGKFQGGGEGDARLGAGRDTVRFDG